VSLFDLAGVAVDYGDRRVLDIPGLAIEEGEVCALLGANGSGKTTLLNILAFLRHPSAGEVRYRDRPVRWSEGELRDLRREVILVHQNPVMFSTTVSGNLEFGLKIRKVRGAERKRIVAEALDLVGMGRFASSAAHHLSGGETQRVAMARALCLSPKVFLCDEPTASVDTENQAIILNILRQISGEKGITVIFTTHDRSHAARIARRTLVIDHGRIVDGRDENIFPGTMEQNGGSGVRLRLHRHLSLRLPRPHGDPVRGRVRVAVDPLLIRFDGGEDGRGANSVSGRVRQGMEEDGRVRVIVDTGLWLTVVLSQEGYRKRPLVVGETVILDIPPEAVRILG